MMITLGLAFLIGVVAGLRAMTAPAAVALAARYGALNVAATPLAFMGAAFTPWILAVLAVGELVTDQLPSTPSRKVPVQFATRVLTGGLSGATLGAANAQLAAGLIAGATGVVIGTLGGAAFRAQLARSFGRDRPAALIEDVVAILGAALIVTVPVTGVS
jgi:uncharacterized membrane protein